MNTICTDFDHTCSLPASRLICFRTNPIDYQEFDYYTTSSTLSELDHTTSMDDFTHSRIGLDKDFVPRETLVQIYEKTCKNNKLHKARILNLISQVPLDMLSIEWLNSEPRTIENKAYLIGNVLPQVVLGLEHVLKEAVARDLIHEDILIECNYTSGHDPNFNPINRLATYLMRNNHKYSNFDEKSPYVRGLRYTVAKLQNQMFMQSDNRLAQLKHAVTQKRECIKQADEVVRIRMEERKQIIEDLFGEFLTKNETKVESAFIHNAVIGYSKALTRLPAPARACLIPIFETYRVDEEPKSYDKKNFVDYVMFYAKQMSNELFEEFVQHFKLCAIEYRKAMERDLRRKLAVKFFLSCNTDQVEGISRQSILHLCDSYFGSVSGIMRELLRNPKEWPIREYHIRNTEPEPTVEEEQPADQLEAQAEGGEVLEQKDGIEQVKPAENHESIVGQNDEHAPAQFPKDSKTNLVIPEEQNNNALVMAPIEIISHIGEYESEVDVKTSVNHMEFNNTEQINEEEVEAGQKSNEILRDQTVNEHDESGSPKLTAQKDDSNEDTCADVEIIETEVHEDGDVPLENEVEREESKPELLKLSQPIRPRENTLHCLLSARSRSLSQTVSILTKRALSFGYSSDRLTLNQFLNLIDTFISESAPISLVQNFLTYLKNNYKEEADEGQSRKHQFENVNVETRKQHLVHKIFELMDVECSRFVDLGRIEKILVRFQDGLYLPHLKQAKEDLDKRIRSSRSAKTLTNPRCDGSFDQSERKSRLNPASFIPKSELASSGSPTIAQLNYQDFFYLMTKTFWPKQDTYLLTNDLDDLQCLELLINHIEDHMELDDLDRLRNKDRLNALHSISQACVKAKFSMEPVYKAMFEALYEDAFVYGQSKSISSRVLLVRSSENEASSKEPHLQYVAISPDIGYEKLVGQCIAYDPSHIYYQVLQTGSALIINRDTSSTNTGGHPSEVIVPIVSTNKFIMGLLHIIAQPNKNSPSRFEPHEVQFYQGISTHLGLANSIIQVRYSIAQAVLGAFQWLSDKLGSDKQLEFYYCQDVLDFTQPQLVAQSDQMSQTRSCILYKLVAKYRGEVKSVVLTDLCIFERESDSLWSYLFDVVDASEPCERVVCNQLHLVYPIRDQQNVTQAIVDLSCEQNGMNAADLNHVNLTLFMLQYVWEIISKRIQTDLDLNREETVSDNESPTGPFGQISWDEDLSDPNFIYEQLALMELDHVLQDLNIEFFSGLQDKFNENSLESQLIHIALALLHPKDFQLSEQINWSHISQWISPELYHSVINFSPFHLSSAVNIDQISSAFSGLLSNDVTKSRSRDVKSFYTWLKLCIDVVNKQSMLKNRSESGENDGGHSLCQNKIIDAETCCHHQHRCTLTPSQHQQEEPLPEKSSPFI